MFIRLRWRQADILQTHSRRILVCIVFQAYPVPDREIEIEHDCPWANRAKDELRRLSDHGRDRKVDCGREKRKKEARGCILLPSGRRSGSTLVWERRGERVLARRHQDGVEEEERATTVQLRYANSVNIVSKLTRHKL